MLCLSAEPLLPIAEEFACGVWLLCWSKCVLASFVAKVESRKDGLWPPSRIISPPLDAFSDDDPPAPSSIEFSSMVKWMLEFLISPAASLPLTYSLLMAACLQALCALNLYPITSGWHGISAWELEWRMPKLLPPFRPVSDVLGDGC